MSFADLVAIGFVAAICVAIGYALYSLLGAPSVLVLAGLLTLILFIRRTYARPHHR